MCDKTSPLFQTELGRLERLRSLDGTEKWNGIERNDKEKKIE
jgi:hypothetical protein